VFDASIYNADAVSECAVSGTEVTKVSASDGDVTTDTMHFSLVDASTIFEIDELSGSITLARELDAEADADKFTLTVQVADRAAGDAAGLTAAVPATVLVSLVDANDNTPKFGKAAYSYTLNERTAAVLDEHADIADGDRDAGNKKVTYRLGAVTPSDPGFQIDTETGALSVPELDYETVRSFTLALFADNTATDCAGEQVTSSVATLVINVVDLNDVKPALSADVYTGAVSEFAVFDTPIDLNVDVTAGDDEATEGANKTCVCRLIRTCSTLTGLGASRLRRATPQISIATTASRCRNSPCERTTRRRTARLQPSLTWIAPPPSPPTPPACAANRSFGSRCSTSTTTTPFSSAVRLHQAPSASTLSKFRRVLLALGP
jgi:hypothetical protein